MKIKHLILGLSSSLCLLTSANLAMAEPMKVLDRNGAYIGVETYAPNIIRVTIGEDYATAASAPGYGFNGKPDTKGFSHTSGEKGDDFTSSQLSLHINAQPWPSAPSMGERYFAPALPPVGLQVKNAKGEQVLAMNGWEKAPHEVNGEKPTKSVQVSVRLLTNIFTV